MKLEGHIKWAHDFVNAIRLNQGKAPIDWSVARPKARSDKNTMAECTECRKEGNGAVVAHYRNPDLCYAHGQAKYYPHNTEAANIERERLKLWHEAGMCGLPCDGKDKIGHEPLEPYCNRPNDGSHRLHVFDYHTKMPDWYEYRFKDHPAVKGNGEVKTKIDVVENKAMNERIQKPRVQEEGKPLSKEELLAADYEHCTIAGWVLRRVCATPDCNKKRHALDCTGYCRQCKIKKGIQVNYIRPDEKRLVRPQSDALSRALDGLTQQSPKIERAKNVSCSMPNKVVNVRTFQYDFPSGGKITVMFDNVDLFGIEKAERELVFEFMELIKEEGLIEVV